MVNVIGWWRPQSRSHSGRRPESLSSDLGTLLQIWGLGAAGFPFGDAAGLCFRFRRHNATLDAGRGESSRIKTAQHGYGS